MEGEFPSGVGREEGSGEVQVPFPPPCGPTMIIQVSTSCLPSIDSNAVGKTLEQCLNVRTWHGGKIGQT